MRVKRLSSALGCAANCASVKSWYIFHETYGTWCTVHQIRLDWCNDAEQYAIHGDTKWQTRILFELSTPQIEFVKMSYVRPKDCHFPLSLWKEFAAW